MAARRDPWSGDAGGPAGGCRRGARARLAAVAVAIASTAAACSTGTHTTASGQADAAFVAEVHQQAPDVSRFKSDSDLIRLGGAACDGFRSGASTVQVADRLELDESPPLLPSQDFGAVLAAAVADLCPQFHARLSPLSGAGLSGTG